MKSIPEYKIGEEVEVMMPNPRNENLMEWREAEILDIRTIYPNAGERHKSYQILIIRTTRTYCKAEPVYNWIGNIPVFVDNNLEFYDKVCDEGIINERQIRPLVKKEYLSDDDKNHPDYLEEM